MAFTIFWLLPLVEIAYKISFLLAKADSCLEKTLSKEKSLLIAVIADVSVVKEIDGSEKIDQITRKIDTLLNV